MSNYCLILIWVAVVWFITMATDVQRIEVVNGNKVRRYQPLWAAIIVLPLVLWTSNRGYVGDTYAYMKIFSELPKSISGIPVYMENVSKDRGFYFLSAIIKVIIGNKVNLYFFIIGAVQAYLVFKVYRKYSINYVISFFLFIVSTDYISWMFNGMRQFLAVTITFAGISFILDKKYIKAFVIILLAATIHGTALLVLPFVFIVQGKAWNKKTLLFISVVIVAVAFVGQFTNILDALLSETQYKNVVSDWQSWDDDGTNVLRVLVYAVPTILSLIGIRYIKEADDPIINLCTNMSIVSMGFYVISMFTSGIFIGRLPIYFSL